MDQDVKVTDRTLRPDIDEDEKVDSSGFALGRSHPERKDGIGPEIVSDGVIGRRPIDNLNSFWSFEPGYFPVELAVETPDEKEINWIMIATRGDWQIALEIEILIREGELTYSYGIIPSHYLGHRPVKYHINHRKGNGVRLIIRDSQIAENNYWWAPIYEVAAGFEERLR